MHDVGAPLPEQLDQPAHVLAIGPEARVLAELEALLSAHNAEQAAPMWPSVLNGPQLIDKHGGQPYEPGDDYIYWPN